MPALSPDPRLDELAGQIGWAAEARKGFDLFFVVANTHAAVQGFADALRRALPDLATANLRDDPRRLLSILRDDLSDAANVLVTGLDAHAKAWDVPGSLFGGLNLDRDAIRALDKNLVVVLPSFALTLLAQAAPDFYDFRTVTLEIADRPDAPGLSPLRFGTPVLAATPEDRDRWIDIIRTQQRPSNPTDEAARMLTLARLLEERGNYVEAESRLRDLISRSDDNKIPREFLSTAYSSLGVVLLKLGRIQQAKDALLRAERMTREAFGREDEGMGVTLANLGSTLRAQGDFAGALEYYQHALRTTRACLGEDSPKIAPTLNNIGDVYQQMGDSATALEVYRESERIFRAALGDDHPEVAVSLSNIGTALETLGNARSALVALREAERILRAAYGDSHPYLATCLNNIGNALHSLGDLDGALASHRDSERIGRRVLGTNHPSLSIWMHNKGTVLQDLGDRKGALSAYSDALLILLRAEGSVDINLADIARSARDVGGDPIEIARRQIGEKAARRVKRALKESRAASAGPTSRSEPQVPQRR